MSLSFKYEKSDGDPNSRKERYKISLDRAREISELTCDKRNLDQIENPRHFEVKSLLLFEYRYVL